MSRPLHIVQLANFYGPRSGGLRTAIDRLASGYVDAGHRVTTIVPGDRDERSGTGTRTVVRIKSPIAPFLGGGYRLTVNRSVVAEILAADLPDVIELSDKTTLATSVNRDPVRHTPVVLVSHERLDALVGRALRSHAALPLVDRHNRRLAQRMSAVVCASRYAAAEFDRIGVATESVPLGVDLTSFRPVVGHRNARTRIVAVVRLSPEKQPRILVDTSRRLIDSGFDHELVVYGDGPCRSALERRSRGLPIRFEGFVADRSRLAYSMATADVGIAPGPFETFGLAALELLASGTPVVVPDCGALAEIADGTSALAVRRTPADFADAVRILAARDRAASGRLARRRAEDYGWERSVERMLAIFGRVTELDPYGDRGVATTGLAAATQRLHRTGAPPVPGAA